MQHIWKSSLFIIEPPEFFESTEFIFYTFIPYVFLRSHDQGRQLQPGPPQQGGHPYGINNVKMV